MLLKKIIRNQIEKINKDRDQFTNFTFNLHYLCKLWCRLLFFLVPWHWREYLSATRTRDLEIRTNHNCQSDQQTLVLWCRLLKWTKLCTFWAERKYISYIVERKRLIYFLRDSCIFACIDYGIKRNAFLFISPNIFTYMFLKFYMHASL